MTDTRKDRHPDGSTRTDPDVAREDSRSDIQQAVDARSDAVARGEGHRGDEPAPFTDSGVADGVGGPGGEVKNQNDDSQ